MTRDFPADLGAALHAAARVPALLVASDYDGTLAPIVANPADARPLPAAAAALRGLAAMPSTTAALVSGRALRDLIRLSGMGSEIVMVGSHGAEFDSGFTQEIDQDLLAIIAESLAGIAGRYRGVTVETKPASVALHVRNADPADGLKALHAAAAAGAGWAAHVTEGKAVVEFAVVTTDKGQAVDVIRDSHGASAVVFLGDDVTDEKAFRRMRGPDVGIKVGDGATLASHRVDSPEQVADVLAFLVDERRAWLAEAG